VSALISDRAFQGLRRAPGVANAGTYLVDRLPYRGDHRLALFVGEITGWLLAN
jgi:hypothetical protein